MKLLATCSALALLALAPVAMAKPIAFAKGRTVMAEYGAGTMAEFQAFYAPTYWSSVGAGWTQFDGADGTRHAYTYVQGNLLVHRWNLPGAQANVFAWGRLGRSTGNDVAGGESARGAGFEADIETRRLYASLKSDAFSSASTFHRTDTLQLGFAPYAHDYDTLATWIVVQQRRMSGDVDDGDETALLVRFFKGRTWVEAGLTTDGKPQAMAMFNF